MKVLLRSLTLALVGSLGAMAELVVNGGFETNVVVNTVNGFDTYGPGLAGWTVSAGTIDVVAKPIYTSFVYEGNQAADMTGTPGRGTITQNLLTAATTNYVLSFALTSNVGPYPNALEVYWNGALLDTVSSPVQGTFQLFTYNVSSTGAGTALAFRSLIGPPAYGNFRGAALDAVSVVAAPTTVPEPTSIAVFGLGGLLLAGLRRRS